jgi:hypothetical protein
LKPLASSTLRVSWTGPRSARVLFFKPKGRLALRARSAEIEERRKKKTALKEKFFEERSNELLLLFS